MQETQTRNKGSSETIRKAPEMGEDIGHSGRRLLREGDFQD